jgi:hypothetical protein
MIRKQPRAGWIRRKEKSMSNRKVVQKLGTGEEPAPATAAEVREALQVTWSLKGHIKNAQVAYIRVCVGLARVRDEELYKRLKHPDIASYAEARLRLGRSSVYKYLQVHDWIKEYHPEWLKPKPKGFIPDLSDVADLIWIEHELSKEYLDPKKRAALEAYLSRLRYLRKRGAELASMPREVIEHLDAAIEILKNAHTLVAAGLHLVKPPKKQLSA